MQNLWNWTKVESKIWGKSDTHTWYTMLLEVWKKGHKFVLKNVAGMSIKDLQKQSSIGVRQNSISAYMHQIFRRTPMRKRDLNKAAAQILLKSNLRMIILLYIYCIFAKQIFWRTPIGDCFWIGNVITLVKWY